METNNVSYRCGILPEQGIGIIENTGKDWVCLEPQSHGIRIFDNNGLAHDLILCSKDGLFYDISSKEGPVDSNISKIWRDKQIGDDTTTGTDIVPELWLPEDIGTFEHYFLWSLEHHLYVRPFDEGKRGTVGYDSNGYPTGLRIDMSLYVDGNLTTASATAEDIPRAGDITFDRVINAHRIEPKISANKAEHVIVGRQAYYIAQDVMAENEYTTTKEMIYQQLFAEPQIWLDIISGALKNRANNRTITVSFEATTDPIGNSRSLQINAPITLPNVTLTGAGSILLWHDSVTANHIVITIGGTAIILTQHSNIAVNGYYLYYANSINLSGAVILTPTGTRKIWDLRIFNNAINESARLYYYNDIKDNSGKVFIPS